MRQVDAMSSNGRSVSSPRRRLHLKPDKDHVANIVSDVQSTENGSELVMFPPVAIVGLVLFTVWSRVTMAASDENLWIVHPDEVYQSVEVAHSEVYNYGFRPYEYLPPPPTEAATSPSQQRHAELGMFALRSWLYPRIYQLLFTTSDYFNWQFTSPFHLSRTFHALVSSFLPLAVYRFALAIYSDVDAAFMSSALTAFTQPLIVLGTRTVVQSLLSPIIFSLTAVVLQSRDSRNDFFRYIACGFGYGLLVSIRFDVLLVTFVIITIHYSKLNRPVFVVIGLVLGFIAGGYSDYVNYGMWFVTTYQWITFQINYAHKLFGTQPVTTYFSVVIGSNHFIIVLSFLTVGLVIYYIVSFRNHQQIHSLMSSTVKVSLSTLVLLTMYSFHKHKEPRFIHDVIVLFEVSLAGTAVVTIRWLWALISSSMVAPKRLLTLFKLLIYAEIFLYAFEERYSYPRSSDPTTVRPWAYAGLSESGLVNQALTFISHRNDVTGVVLDYSIHMCGGYTIIHKDVPLIAKTHFEFREWDKKARISVGGNVSISTIDGVSNFISVYNSQLLLKYVIDKEEYNYVVITGGRKFLSRGFHRVFNVSDVVVYKRSKSRYEKEILSKISDGIPVGTNATVLEYESSWLVTLELYEKAAERVKPALVLDPGRIRLWQLLHLSLMKLGKQNEAEKVMQECYNANGKYKCHQAQDKVVMHPEYQIQL